MHAILAAIVADDRARVRKLIKADPGLTTRLVSEAHLYESKIVHWIYVGDTALHLAAAGHRVELVRLLLAAGADPNSAKNHRRSGPLHYAADGNGPDWNTTRQVQTIQCLLEAGADVNIPDRQGATPPAVWRSRWANWRGQAGCSRSRWLRSPMTGRRTSSA